MKRRQFFRGAKGIRRKGIRWSYNGDGRYFPERIKGKDKKYWRRWKKRELKKLDK